MTPVDPEGQISPLSLRFPFFKGQLQGKESRTPIDPQLNPDKKVAHLSQYQGGNMVEGTKGITKRSKNEADRGKL